MLLLLPFSGSWNAPHDHGLEQLLVLPICACQVFLSSRIVFKRSSIVQRQPSRVERTSDADLWKAAHRVGQRRCPQIPSSKTQEPASCRLPLLDQKLSTPGSRSTPVPLGDIGPKPVGCIYSLHPGCHTFEDTTICLTNIGFPITEMPSKGVTFVASRSRVPGRTTCPSLCGSAGCWPKVPSTTLTKSAETRYTSLISPVHETA